VRATVSFDVEWSSVLDMAPIHNSTQASKVRLSARELLLSGPSEQPGFRFESEMPDPGRNLISVLGREQIGAFFRIAPMSDSQ
jgi:hypothetical protein